MSDERNMVKGERAMRGTMAGKKKQTEIHRTLHKATHTSTPIQLSMCERGREQSQRYEDSEAGRRVVRAAFTHTACTAGRGMTERMQETYRCHRSAIQRTEGGVSVNYAHRQKMDLPMQK